MFSDYICENIHILAVLSVQKKEFWFPWQTKNSGTQASIEQMKCSSNETKTLIYPPPV